MSTIRDWLATLGLSECADRFQENRVDLGILPDLTDEDLEKLGVILGAGTPLCMPSNQPDRIIEG
jgi:SAM domain (Sterile alpha motif)